MAEGARLESVYTFTGIGGSNPSLSAIRTTTMQVADRRYLNKTQNDPLVVPARELPPCWFPRRQKHPRLPVQRLE